MNVQQVQAAIKKGGSIRGAAKLLGKSYTALQWWLAQNGYEVIREARLVRNHRLTSVEMELTAKGQAAVEGEK